MRKRTTQISSATGADRCARPLILSPVPRCWQQPVTYHTATAHGLIAAHEACPASVADCDVQACASTSVRKSKLSTRAQGVRTFSSQRSWEKSYPGGFRPTADGGNGGAFTCPKCRSPVSPVPLTSAAMLPVEVRLHVALHRVRLRSNRPR